MPIGIYPPTLQSSQPAFLSSSASYNINFTLQKITQFEDIGHIQIRIVRQVNNRSIANTAKYPDGTIYKPTTSIVTNPNDSYSVAINLDDLSILSWEPGVLYKVQARFGTTPMFSTVSEFATWKKQQIDKQTFSEWSTVMIIKAISKPDVYIKNAEEVVSEEVQIAERSELTLTPIFFGACAIAEENKELQNKFKFDLYLDEKSAEDFEANYYNNLVESSGWLQHNAAADSYDEYRFKNILNDGTKYTVIYSIETVNGYAAAASPYIFIAQQTYLSRLEGVSLEIDDTDVYCAENGCINLYLTTDEGTYLTGSFVISRSDERTNYVVWEDIKYISCFLKPFARELIFQDFTIESGIRYKYAFQQENASGIRTTPTYDATNTYHVVNFEHSYLYHNGVQLRLMFNHKLSSFKHTVLSSKQDTLGSKYPHLVRNGYAYYAEFPITGTISFQSDPDQTFLQLEEKGFFYQDDLIIPRHKFIEQSEERGPNQGPGPVTNYNHLTIDYNLDPDNVYVERKYREKVEEFLNNFDYKLYKSATEGNIVIILQNVTMTPNTSLGRMIYDFSATAYEVAENTIESLNHLNIIDIGSYESLSLIDAQPSFGQVKGLYVTKDEPNIDIFAMIKKQEEVNIPSSGYKLSLNRITSFWVERYGTEESILNNDYNEAGSIIAQQVRNREIGTADLVRLNAELAQAKSEKRPTAAIEQEIDTYTKLQEKIRTGWIDSTILIKVNGKEIMVAPHKVYSILEPVTELELVASDYPIMINYTTMMDRVEDNSVGLITAIDTSRIWGQVAGIFTTNEELIKMGYNFNYGTVNEEPYRVYSGSNVGAVYEGDKLIVDGTEYNLFKSLNLYNIIKEQTRHQVEDIYGIEDGFQEDEDGSWKSPNGELWYFFSGITTLEIEAEPNTTLLIDRFEDGRRAIKIKIGETGRYTLSPMDNLIRYLRLEKPGFALVNYKCLTTQYRVRM